MSRRIYEGVFCTPAWVIIVFVFVSIGIVRGAAQANLSQNNASSSAVSSAAASSTSLSLLDDEVSTESMRDKALDFLESSQGALLWRLGMVSKEQYGWAIPANLFLSMIATESSFDPEVISPDGCAGLCQLNIAAHNLSFDQALDPDTNVRFGYWYMMAMYAEFGSWEKALIAWNAGQKVAQNPGKYPEAYSKAKNFADEVIRNSRHFRFM